MSVSPLLHPCFLFTLLRIVSRIRGLETLFDKCRALSPFSDKQKRILWSLRTSIFHLLGWKPPFDKVMIIKAFSTKHDCCGPRLILDWKAKFESRPPSHTALASAVLKLLLDLFEKCSMYLFESGWCICLIFITRTQHQPLHCSNFFWRKSKPVCLVFRTMFSIMIRSRTNERRVMTVLGK